MVQVGPKQRHALPQLDGSLYLLDGGLETSMLFLEGFDLPCFATFNLLKDEKGKDGMRKYFQSFLELSKEQKVGFILEATTWRCNVDWASKLGYTANECDEQNRVAIQFAEELRNEFNPDAVIAAVIGPRGDGYLADSRMTVDEAELYISRQIAVFASTNADFVQMKTLTYVEEAIGGALAAKKIGMPIVISFTTETDGRLPSGMSLKDAIEAVDKASDNYPVYFMLNCSHPTHFASELKAGIDQPWIRRLRALKGNASTKSHAELNDSISLDSGNPEEFGLQIAEFKKIFPHLNIFGGCCGSDLRHVKQVYEALSKGQ